MKLYFVGPILLILDKFAKHSQCMGIFSAMLYICCCFNAILVNLCDIIPNCSLRLLTNDQYNILFLLSTMYFSECNIEVQLNLCKTATLKKTKNWFSRLIMA